MTGDERHSSANQEAQGPAPRRSLDYRLTLEIVAAVLGLATLVFLALQTVSAREQAWESAHQTTAARLDGLYQQLLAYDQWRGQNENKHINMLLNQVDNLDDIKDPEERDQFYSVEVWFVDYFDYVYSTLPDLLRCVPDDGHLVLRGSREESRTCDEWVAWSETIHRAFQDPVTCQVLHDDEPLYEKKFVTAIRESKACPAQGGRPRP
ncbi:hypothetical protein [Streptomyces naphthomycinicus]|uniref:hypothetical protein n=1 Tax=Streptomyces naphthomycinicus TaxID=2872625 RepID=UPI001CECB586|nr:hypothetical protein [Streptomyces sp. TML10]